ncbi:MAG: flavin reductase family protein [Pseudomonadota bacterium]
MFYRPADGHGLPHNPFKAIVTPRPIGWISTVDEAGVANLAPYSFFNALADAPPMVMFSSTGGKPDQPHAKDSVANVRATGVFCANIVSEALTDAMNASAGFYGKGEDEFEISGLTKAPCETIAAPRVAEAPASLECKLWKVVDLPGEANVMVIGEVTGIHLRNDCVVDGRFDVTRYIPLSRLGYRDYTAVREVFELKRPGE